MLSSTLRRASGPPRSVRYPARGHEQQGSWIVGVAGSEAAHEHVERCLASTIDLVVSVLIVGSLKLGKTFVHVTALEMGDKSRSGNVEQRRGTKPSEAPP
jgi:hypothetical protein